MPGVNRPQTLTDVLGIISGQATGNTSTSVSGVGYFLEADDQAAVADTVSLSAGVNPAWGGGTWGAVTWG